MKNIKILFVLSLLGFFLISCNTKKLPNKEMSIDFECYNLCIDATKGMTITELKSFCKLQCTGSN